MLFGFALILSKRIKKCEGRFRKSNYSICIWRSKVTLELKKALANQNDLTADMQAKIQKMIPEIAWMLLGSLNGGNSSSIHIKYTHKFIEIASELPLSQAYPVLSWVIENARCRYANTPQAQTYLRPMYNAALIGTQLTARMTVRSFQELEQAKLLKEKKGSETKGIYRVGDREKVISLGLTQDGRLLRRERMLR